MRSDFRHCSRKNSAWMTDPASVTPELPEGGDRHRLLRIGAVHIAWR